MRILLLTVCSETEYNTQICLPFGLASIGSYVQPDGHELMAIDMNAASQRAAPRYLAVDSALLERIMGFAPELVAMSTYSANIHNALFWAQTIKQALPECRIVLGGNHASYIAKEILETCSAVDFVVRFEGEIGFRALCRELADKTGRFDRVPNLIYRDGAAIVETPLAPLIQPLDSLPKLNRDLFRDTEPLDQTHADLITARGCPFQCIFCNCNHFWNKRYRHFSCERVIEDIADLKQRYPKLHTVRFRDEAISIDRTHCLELCRLLKQADFRLSYQGHSRLDGLDEEVIARLAEVGFNRLFIGLESGSPAVLKRLKKGIHIEKAPQIVKWLRKYGLPIRFSLMTATHDETLAETLETVKLVKAMDLELDEFYFGYGLQIYPGTEEATRFLQTYPDYRWLETRALGNGYHQSRDAKDKPTIITYAGSNYVYADVMKEADREFAPKLQALGYAGFSELAAEQDHLRVSLDRLRNEPHIERSIQALFSAIDGKKEGWAVYGRGTLYNVLRPYAQKSAAYQHCLGVITPEQLAALAKISGQLRSGGGPTAPRAGISVSRSVAAERDGHLITDELPAEGPMKQILNKAKILVLAMTDWAADNAALELLERWNYRGELIRLERYLVVHEYSHEDLLVEHCRTAPPARADASRFEPILVEEYVLSRMALLRKRFPRLLLFGAGKHTEWLLKVCGTDGIAGICDEHPSFSEKRIQDVPILGVEEAARLRYDAVVVSSDVRQKTLLDRATTLWGREKPVEGIYSSRLPKGPYPKRRE